LTAKLDARHRRLLALLGVATLFEGYDRFIASLALPYIGRDLGASEAELGYALSAIRVGALWSIALGWAADRYGRRRVLLFTVLAYTLATAATGISRSLEAFVVWQLFATIFLTAELALAQVVVAEELPAAMRGRGQGFLGAFAAMGAGVAAMLFPLLQSTALGWRGLYFIGVLPLLVVAYLRRSLPETRRWSHISAAPAMRQGLGELLRRPLRTRFLILNGLAVAVWTAASPAFGFASYHATNALGWSAGQVSALVVGAGALGMGGWFVLGHTADRFGRRSTGAASMLLGTVAVVAYYRTPWLVPAFAALVFAEAGVNIALNALGTELFPTHLRATAKSWITNAGILGALIGLAIVGALSERLGGADDVIALLAVLPLLAAPLLFTVRETHRAELEALSG
jgi:putative MFS transporter